MKALQRPDEILARAEFKVAQCALLMADLRLARKMEKAWPEAFAKDCQCSLVITGLRWAPDYTGDRLAAPFGPFKRVNTCGLMRSDNGFHPMTIESMVEHFGDKS